MGRGLRLSRTFKKSQTIILPLAIIAFMALVAVAPTVGALSLQQQINELRQKNRNNYEANQELEETETSLKDTLSALRSKIETVTKQIDKNKATQRKLNQQIKVKKKELAQQKAVLGSNVRQLYLDDQMTTIEKLASSRDLSEFVDKEQYNMSVQSKIQDTMEQINKLKNELEANKKQVEATIRDREQMQNELNKDKAKQQQLLGLNQSEQALYDRRIAGNNARIAQLQREQAAQNAQGFVGAISASGTGGYPWAFVPFPNSMPDPWGMYKRQCVSYTAWKVANSGRHMPYWGGRGNANLWDDNARRSGIPVDGKPRVGDVAVSNAGFYGHVMYVEAVHGDGTITISQYNAGWDGRYSTGRRSTTGLVFIHF